MDRLDWYQEPIIEGLCSTVLVGHGGVCALMVEYGETRRQELSADNLDTETQVKCVN